MGAIIYGLPVPTTNYPVTANVISLPKHTKYGLQETLPFEWPNQPKVNYLSPRVTEINSNDFQVQPTGRKDLPPAKDWAQSFVQSLIEVINGDRAISQLLRWVTPEVMSAVKYQLNRKELPKFKLNRVSLHETDDGVAEVSAVFSSTKKSYAMAMRLEGLDGKWRATSIVWGI